VEIKFRLIAAVSFKFYFQLHLHSSNMDYEKFYKNHIPKQCLPSDFGGDLETVAELHEKHCQEFMRLRPYFVAEEQQAALKFDVSEKTSLQSELINESERGIKNMTLSD
jgi:hypothetical protein